MAPRLLGLLVALALRCAGVAAFHAPPITRRAPQHRTRLLAAGDVDDGAEEVVLGEADAVATLGLVTALWGSQHAVAKWALGFDGGGAPALTALRFAVAAAALSPFLPRDASTWRDGLELGAWGFLGFACQTVGLETTTACRSAFLLYLNVKLVPVRAAQESEIPNFKGSDLGQFPLVSADFWTSDHLLGRSRSVDVFSGTRARGTLTLKRT